MKKVIYILFVFATFPKSTCSQEHNTKLELNDSIKHKVWANIFASYFTTIKGENKPLSAFEMPTALLGYSTSFGSKFKGTLIYDVTRTTNAIKITDDLGNTYNVTYNEGSRYTAYLKMAEITYSPLNFMDVRFGQLLNSQYLTMQDKFWGYRYVYFTYQEVHRYGNPADFGAQIDLKYRNYLLTQFSITNGDGPFKHQDEEAKFLYAANIEYYPVKGAILKVYADYAPFADTVSVARDRSALSLFAGYRTSKFRVASEYNRVFNYGFRENNSYWGISSFFSYSFSSIVDVLIRYDYINRSMPLNLSKTHLLIYGIQLQPIKSFNISVNLRNLIGGSNKTMIYVNSMLNF